MSEETKHILDKTEQQLSWKSNSQDQFLSASGCCPGWPGQLGGPQHPPQRQEYRRLTDSTGEGTDSALGHVIWSVLVGQTETCPTGSQIRKPVLKRGTQKSWALTQLLRRKERTEHPGEKRVLKAEAPTTFKSRVEEDEPIWKDADFSPRRKNNRGKILL